MRKIISVTWFQHGGHSFGIVITENSEGVKKAWIGVVAGIDPKKDMINIATTGAKFPLTPAMNAININGETLLNPIEVPV